MLINLSNHPSSNWSEAQKKAGLHWYGPIEDMPFPNIPPELSTEEVKKIAEQYFVEISKRTATSFFATVHLMGEMTFVVALIPMLQKENINVVCSTTKRTVIEEKNGLKTAQFEFVQFRTYPICKNI